MAITLILACMGEATAHLAQAVAAQPDSHAVSSGFLVRLRRRLHAILSLTTLEIRKQREGPRFPRGLVP